MDESPNPNLLTDDPAVAIVIDRLGYLARTLDEHRRETKNQIAALHSETKNQISALRAEVRQDIDEVRTFMTEMKEKLTMWKGGWKGASVVIVTIAAILSYVFGLWDVVTKFFSSV